MRHSIYNFSPNRATKMPFCFLSRTRLGVDIVSQLYRQGQGLWILSTPVKRGVCMSKRNKIIFGIVIPAVVLVGVVVGWFFSSVSLWNSDEAYKLNFYIFGHGMAYIHPLFLFLSLFAIVGWCVAIYFVFVRNGDKGVK